MIRWHTAGESHGPALIAFIEGIPSGIEISVEYIQQELARRRLGYGRGARMSFEKDALRVLSGIRFGKTLGSPIAIEIANSEWPKWEKVMSPFPVAPEELAQSARAVPLTRPRPGHADLSGMLKYDQQDARPILERASARETAARVTVGAVVKQFLQQVADIRVFSHILSIGPSKECEAPLPHSSDLPKIDKSPVRASTPEREKAIIAEIEAAKNSGDTLGGVFEVIAENVPIGLGTYVDYEYKLDARLASALMSINAIKGVEIGDGFVTARRRGSQAHDEIITENGINTRATNRAGGIEGGMSNGETIVTRAAMKPISTVPRPLRTVDVSTGEPAVAIHQRSDICAVPAAGVVGEAMVAIVLAQAISEKFGGDSVAEIQRNFQSYCDHISQRIGYISPSPIDRKKNPELREEQGNR